MYMNPFQPLVGFRSEKAAQIAAYFIHAHGGHMEKLALIKMIYIAERESVRLRGRPMVYDELYSLKDGPICSSALDGINGNIDTEVWSQYLILRGDRDVLADLDAKNKRDELSRSDIRILNGVLDVHKGKTSSQLRNWLHDPENCPEYIEVFGNGRAPIAYSELARAVGTQDPQAIEHSVALYRESESLLPKD